MTISSLRIGIVYARLTKLQRLLIAGVSANANDGAVTNNKVLHWAASFGGQEAVKLLCGNYIGVT